MLEVRNASKIYGEGPTRVVALDNVSLEVENGNFIAVMGPSGSGKSTLLNIIGGLDQLSSGEVILDGKRIDGYDENALVEIRRGKIAYVFQQYHLLPSLTALENVLMPLVFAGKGQNEKEALDILKRVGLEKRAGHKPSQLSGGEQQRVAIARTLVTSPELILADEPTGNMDQKTGNEILELFKELNAEGRSIVMVTHSPDIAKHAKEIIYLQDGQVIKRTNNHRGEVPCEMNSR
ncbi:MAG: ABC transporter ATP-binding protein [Chloroflexi bacterium]|nr:ABC transporter ATP-binding protein [Chloroflexota bacterium]